MGPAEVFDEWDDRVAEVAVFYINGVEVYNKREQGDSGLNGRGTIFEIYGDFHLPLSYALSGIDGVILPGFRSATRLDSCWEDWIVCRKVMCIVGVSCEDSGGCSLL